MHENNSNQPEQEKKNNNTNTKKERNKLRCDQFEIASLSHMILRWAFQYIPLITH